MGVSVDFIQPIIRGGNKCVSRCEDVGRVAISQQFQTT